MANNYTYSKLADEQIADIYRYTASEWGLDQADKYDTGLLETIQLLAGNPDMGRKCDHIRKGYRRHEYGSHIIFDRKRETDIFIVQVLPDRMDLERHL